MQWRRRSIAGNQGHQGWKENFPLQFMKTVVVFETGPAIIERFIAVPAQLSTIDGHELLLLAPNWQDKVTHAVDVAYRKLMFVSYNFVAYNTLKFVAHVLWENQIQSVTGTIYFLDDSFPIDTLSKPTKR